MEIQDMLIYSRTLPARRAAYADYPQQMHPELKKFLADTGVAQLYTHQAEMFERAKNGENLVITTSTASGKTLSFLLPVIQAILENPLTRAIFVYPTKALAADQYRALQPYLEYFGDSRISAGVYDGDTAPAERTRIRKNANIILTNPEMLNGAFLPNHSRYGFDFIFSNLKFIVFDELHTYRGVFGSHVANVCRRLTRITRYYKSQPQFLCSSATIANAQQLAQELTGQTFGIITKDGSPSAAKTYAFLQPPRIVDERRHFLGQEQAASIAAQMIPGLIKEGHTFIAFARSRREVEVVLRESRDRMSEAETIKGLGNMDKVAGYRGGYTPAERHAIESRMIGGDLKGLVSTNALELGIDIGRVDTTLLVGYPGTRASFWQQTGRAGRGRNACTNYLILESQPVDQYIGLNPLWLFENGTENAVIDKDNLLIELAHVRSAAAELPLTLDDIALFPDLGEAIPVLMKVGELKNSGGKFLWAGNAFPAGDYSLRNMDQNRYKLMDKEKHIQITEMDELQAFHELHEGAVYMHEGRQYQVVELDLETRTAQAVPFDGNYYTMPGSETEVKVVRQIQQEALGRTDSFWGDVNVNETVFMYKKLQFHNHQNLGYEQLRQPLSKAYDTEALWVRMPKEVTSTYRRLLQPDSNGRPTRNNHFEGLMHALNNAARMVTMAETEDIGVSMSSNVIDVYSPDNDGDEVFFYLYDKFVGGLGYARKAYDHLGEILEAAISLVQGCGCKDGCAACVGDYKLDRQVVLWGLRSIKESLPAPASYKYVEYAVRPEREKAFKYEELANVWPAFCEHLIKNGEKYGNFLESLVQICVEHDILTMFTKSEFLAQWAGAKENLLALKNIIRYYTDAPASLKLRVCMQEEKGEDAADLFFGNAKAPGGSVLEERLENRYRNLNRHRDNT